MALYLNGKPVDSGGGIKTVIFDIVASHPTDPSTYSVVISVGSTSVFSRGYPCSIWGEFSATTSTFIYDSVEYTVVAQGFSATTQGATCFSLSINNVIYNVPLANRQNSSYATSDSFSILVKTGSITADYVSYDHSTSGLQADTVQDAIDELETAIPTNAELLPITSGSATNTKSYIDNIADYSTSEKAVGKWIDGKTVYQKVIPVNITASNTWNNIETINGITRIISAEFLIYEGGNRSNGIRQGLFAEISTTVPYLVQIFNNTGYDIQVDYMILKYIKS